MGEQSRSIVKINSYVSPDNTEKEEEKKFQFYINDGFQRLERDQFHNAIFQFELAVKSKPDNLNAQLGLTQALLGKCIKTEDDCIKAEEQYTLFMKKYSDNEFAIVKLSTYLLSVGDSSKVELLY